MSAGKVATPAGRALAIAVTAAALAALGWLLWSLPGWVDGWHLNRSTGILVVGALGLVLIVGVPLSAGLLYATIAVTLEGMGATLERPDVLSEGDETRAAAASAHTVWYVYTSEDDFGKEVTWGVLVSAHPSEAIAEADRAKRSGPPAKDIDAGGRYERVEPCNLLALHEAKMLDLAGLRAVLAGRSTEIKPQVRYSPYYYRQYLKSAPLTRDECRRAHALKMWTVYYEDHFHVGPNRESYPVAVCFSEEEAEAEVQRRGPLAPGFDGYLHQGPYPLIIENHRTPDIGADTVREVLRRAETGERGAVPLR